MKKLYILGLVLFISSCTASSSLLDVSYDQLGVDCIYTEKAGRREKTMTGKETIYIAASKTITYPNTHCSKVIESDLKSGINKNQTIYSVSGPMAQPQLWNYK